LQQAPCCFDPSISIVFACTAQERENFTSECRADMESEKINAPNSSGSSFERRAL
jgi:hypothetical protein